MMNGISSDSKQGFETAVSGSTETGESPTLPGKPKGKGRTKKAKKTKETTRISVISSGLNGSVIKIQDGAEHNDNVSSSLPELGQLENLADRPVLSIPDSVADNETISRLLGGQSQGAALLDLGSSAGVNIDFIPENVDFTDETAIEEAMQTTDAAPAPGTSAAVSGAAPEASPEPWASTVSRPRPVLDAVSISCLGNSEVEAATVKDAFARLTQQLALAGKGASVALDLSTKADKLPTMSVCEALNSISQEIKLRDSVSNSASSTTSTNSNTKKIVSLVQSGSEPGVLLSNLSSTSGDDETSGRADETVASSSSSQQMSADVISEHTGDSLLLNLAQENNSLTDEADHIITQENEESATQNEAKQMTNPVTYIITSRDKESDVTQRFRVVVDPESVMYIPVMNLKILASENDFAGSSDEAMPLISCEEAKDSHRSLVEDKSDADAIAEEVEGSRRLQESLLGSGVTTIPPETKEDLRTITGDMISSALLMHGSREAAQDKTADNAGDEGKAQGWTKKTPQKKKEAQEEHVCDQPGCGATIVGKTKFRAHKLAHNDDRPHKCPHEDCDWSFPSLYKLRRHIAGHTGAKPFVCGMENCGKQFSTLYNLKMHLNSHFRQTVEICEYEGCGKVFNSAALLKIHQRKHFEEQRLKCEYPGCTKSFTTSSALGSHQRVHVRDATNYPCPFEGCNKVYDKACRLKLHKRSHTGERPFKCTFEGCDWAFTCVQKLTRHIVRHTGERKYRCTAEGCNKLFTRLEHLKSHEVFHSGQKPYACKEEGCNARFAARSSLYMHQKRHLQAKPMRRRNVFTCPLDSCDMSFASKLGLKSHIIKGHGIPLPFTGGAGDFELIGLGNAQLHGSQASVQATGSETEPTAAQPTISLPQITADLMASNLLQTAALPQTSTAISLNSLTSSGNEGAITTLASGLLPNQLFLYRTPGSAPAPAPFNLPGYPTKDTDTDPAATSTTGHAPTVVSMVTQPPILSLPPSFLTTPHVSVAPSSLTLPSASLVTTPTSQVAQTTPVTTPMITFMPVGGASVPGAAATGATPGPGVQSSAIPKVFREHRSGSARTDYRAVSSKHPLPPGALDTTKMSDDLDVESLSQSDSSQSSDGALHATFIPLNMMTSSSLTLRDPATGTRYIQTQLLQDDPPDMPDMGFPLGSHDAGDQSPLDTSMSVSAMLDETENEQESDRDFMAGGEGVHSEDVLGFRGSTINLQDLE